MALETVTGQRPAAKKRIATEIIDSDVHTLAKAGLKTVWNYFPEVWQQHFAAKGVGLGSVAVGVAAKTMRFSHPTGAGVRSDAVGPDGGPPGSDAEFVRADLLDKWDVDIAIVNAIDAAAYAAALANPDEASVICEANNRYFLEEWVPVDQRYRYLLSVSPQDPLASAKEIRRAGGHPQAVGIFLPPINILLGNRYYHPIYEAAAEMDLPIWSHVTGIELVHQGSAVGSGGWPETYAERRSSTAQIAETSVGSIVFSGVLERYPNLRFCFAEYGFTWALSLMWRMDGTWRTCRRETPWVKKSPSEYVRERIRFTTQPLDEPTNPQDVIDVVKMIGPETIMFSSDYPHWDNDNPQRVLQTWPQELRDQICSTTPRAFWRL